MAHSPFIVIDGTDGSGKGTQTKLLVERLEREGTAVAHLSFPRYKQPEAYFIEQYLNGAYGSAQEVGPYRASVLFAVERFHVSGNMRKLLDEGVTLVADRYVSANKGHQMGKIANPAERKQFLDWLNDFEYGLMGVPKPDLTVLLHMPSEIAYELIEKKDARGYLDGKKRDIHEADPGHLKAAEEAYLELPKIDDAERWTVLECAPDGRLQSIEEIHERLYALVKQHLP